MGARFTRSGYPTDPIVFFQLTESLTIVTMKLFLNTIRITTTFLSAALINGAATAQTVTVADAWVRATVAAQRATGAFLKLTVQGADATLIAAASPVAGVTQIHEMAMSEGVMRMREVAGGLTLKAGQSFELKPGGYHIMMMDLKQPVKAGDRVPLTLTFKQANGRQTTAQVDAEVRGLNGQAAMQHGKMH
jgi:periplasmic copper chaperone A